MILKDLHQGQSKFEKILKKPIMINILQLGYYYGNLNFKQHNNLSLKSFS